MPGTKRICFIYDNCRCAHAINRSLRSFWIYSQVYAQIIAACTMLPMSSLSVSVYIPLLLFILLSVLTLLRVDSISSPGAISSFSPGGQYIMLTFEDGPQEYTTSKILDILKEYNVHATFFVIGQNVAKNHDIIKRMHDEKHEIGVHGWQHHRMTSMQLDRVHKSITLTTNEIHTVANVKPKTVRPPDGATNAQINDYLRINETMKVVLWSLDSKDYDTTDPVVIASTVIDKAKPGDVILFHDTFNHTIDALRIVIVALQKQSYEFLTLSQVFSFPDDSPH